MVRRNQRHVVATRRGHRRRGRDCDRRAKDRGDRQATRDGRGSEPPFTRRACAGRYPSHKSFGHSRRAAKRKSHSATPFVGLSLAPGHGRWPPAIWRGPFAAADVRLASDPSRRSQALAATSYPNEARRRKLRRETAWWHPGWSSRRRRISSGRPRVPRPPASGKRGSKFVGAGPCAGRHYRSSLLPKTAHQEGPGTFGGVGCPLLSSRSASRRRPRCTLDPVSVSGAGSSAHRTTSCRGSPGSRPRRSRT